MKSIIFIYLVFLSFLSYSQGDNNSSLNYCVDRFINTIKEERNNQNFEDCVAIHQIIENTVTLGTKYKNRVNSEKIESFLSKDMKYLINENLELISDNENSLVISKNDKNITILKNIESQRNDSNFDFLLKFQDSLSVYIESASSKIEMKNNTEFEVIELEMAKKGITVFQITKMTIWINMETNKIKTYLMDYPEYRKEKSLLTTIHVQEKLDDLPKVLNQSIERFIYNKNGTLLTKYNDYEVNDLRNIKQ